MFTNDQEEASVNSIDQQFVEFIVKSLVSKPDNVQVERRIDEKGVLLELTVDPEDLGRVIGKRGATAQSLRTLLRALGTKNDARYNLKIVDNGEPGSGSVRPSDTPADQPAQDIAQSDDQGQADVDNSNDQDETSEQEQPKPEPKNEDDDNNMASRTRKELAELDDLDV